MAELEELRARLAEAEETLRAIRSGEVDALLIAGEKGNEVKLLGAGDRIYRQFIETANEGTATVSAAGEILSCNDYLAKTLRRPLDQVYGSAMRDHVSPDDHETLSAILAQAGPEFRRRKIHLKTSEGRLVPVYLSATLLHSAGTEPVFCLVLTDLEEVISAEQTLRGSEEEAWRSAAALRESEEKYSKAFRTSPYAITITRADDGTFIEVNDAFISMTGFTREEALADSSVGLKLWVNEEDRQQVLADLHAGRVVVGKEYPFRARDGKLGTGLFSAQIMMLKDGPCILSSINDITERVRCVEERAGLEDQLRQAQKVESIGRLAGGVAHDFNNLTAIILGYGEMLLGRLRPEDPLRKYAEQIMEAGLRSAALTRQLLAFSRKQTLQPEVLDLNGLLKNFEKMLGRLIREDVQLELKLAATLGRVMADPGQIEQVVTNLVLNARDAMAKGGRLTIETADVELDQIYALGHESVVPGRYVMLALTDTGCGIDQANMAKLFEPFYTTKESGKGTGLGLATVYGIVNQSGGYIWAYSEPGKGTSFKIYLPRTDAAVTEKAVQPGGEAPRGRGELILLVEDEVSLRALCETVLVHLGYRVSAAGSGPEALLLMEEKRLEPDLVITDVIMPGMSGSEMAERLRKDRPHLKVLYMSGYPDDAISRHGVLDQGTPFIQKPFNERTLATKVRETLGGTQPGRSVLMIDDDAQFREFVQHFCTKRGYVIAGVSDAAAAIAALAGQHFDVLLVDKNIPGTSGEHILREIRAAGHATPAIVLTGDVASADMDLLRPLGVVRALEKSSNAEPLLQAIEAAGTAGG